MFYVLHMVLQLCCFLLHSFNIMMTQTSVVSSEKVLQAFAQASASLMLSVSTIAAKNWSSGCVHSVVADPDVELMTLIKSE